MHAMESYCPRRPSLARGRPRGAPGQRRGMAAGVVLPVGVRALRAVVLDPVPAGGQLEIVPVHSSGAHPRHGSLPALGGATRVSETERLRFQDFAFQRLASGRCHAKVVLSWGDGRQFTGESDGVISQAGELRCCAEATVRALERVVQPKLGFELLGVKAVRAFDAVVVIVSLSARQETRASRLVGAYLAEADPPRGADRRVRRRPRCPRTRLGRADPGSPRFDDAIALALPARRRLGGGAGGPG